MTLYGVAILVPAYAAFDDVYSGLNSEYCMADAYLFEDGNKLVGNPPALNCTANDVEITKVDPVNASEECTLGETFTFPADVTVKTNANERWDVTFYLPLTEQDPDVVHVPAGVGTPPGPVTLEHCSIILPKGGTSGETADVDLDGDECGDITKAFGPDEYTLENINVTMICLDADNDNRADFTYCAAWDNIERDNCTVGDDYPGQIPNNKSKCNCDTFNIDVFINPDPPAITKTLTSTNTRTEPGGTYNFSLSFTNPNANTSIFLTSLSDEVDVADNGTYNEAGDESLNLWGGNPALDLNTEGVYLTATNCAQPANGGEILPSATYSCEFTVHIVDFDLPDDQSPELYDDVIRLTLEDKNGDDVTNGETCPAGLIGVAGQFCSNEKAVQVTNLPPTITVVKTASPTQVPESGATVTYTVRVNNTSANYDSPMTLTSLMDDKFGDLTAIAGTTCATGGSIAFGSFYECRFDQFISGTGAGSHTNVATAKAIDNEADEASDSDDATVQINDIPSAITLTKTADPTSVLETGDDPTVTRSVDYTLLFSVNTIAGGQTAVDTVTFSSLTDNKFGIWTGDCVVDMMGPIGNLSPIPDEALNGFMLDPGEEASCTITEQLTGNSGDTHTNVATINGTDEDGQPVEAMDSATVTFTPSAPATEMKFAASMLVVLELHNAGIEDVNLTALTMGGFSVFVGVDGPLFRLMNTGGDFDGTNYGACVEDQELGYEGSGTEDYSCAFTIEFKPGLENTDDVDFLEDVVVTVEDDEGDEVINDVTIDVLTVE